MPPSPCLNLHQKFLALHTLHRYLSERVDQLHRMSAEDKAQKAIMMETKQFREEIGVQIKRTHEALFAALYEDEREKLSAFLRKKYFRFRSLWQVPHFSDTCSESCG